MKILEPRIIGRVGVDTGILWIGDSCYILHLKPDILPSTLGKSWDEFCNILGNDRTKSFNCERGHEGLGVCTSTGGDCSYNVIGFFKKDYEVPSFVMIDFEGNYFD